MQSPVEVRNEVLHVLQANREADQARINGQGRIGHGLMRHQRRNFNERLDAAERLGQGKETCMFGKTPRRLASAF